MTQAPSAARLDQFFTQPAIAQRCWERLHPQLPGLTGAEVQALFFVEPSAGDGAFCDVLPAAAGKFAVDIAPQRADILTADFLSLRALPAAAPAAARTVVIGNPPFGRRGAAAVRFFCKSAAMAHTIAMIVPVIFRKHIIHKQLPSGWRWIDAMPLPRAAFRTVQKSAYAANTEFQIWTRLPSAHTDRRRHDAPAKAHADFEMWQYNNTRRALKVFLNPFEFAIPCQGWQDYTRREKRAAGCEKHKQWMLLKPHTPAARERLLEGIDYGKLAWNTTTSTPGFRKGDLVEEYVRELG